jgi:aspartate/methionine/tyrosine aminotransferase
MRGEWLERVEGDFCDHLPLFFNVSAIDDPQSGVFDFGISDIRFVPALETAIRRATTRLVACVHQAASKLPGMQGHAGLCEKLASLISRETGAPTSADDLVLTDGGCDGIALAAQTVCGPGEGIAYAVPAFPYWWVLSHAGVPQLPVAFENARDYSENFGCRMIEVLENEPRACAIILNEPHNPLGVAISPESIKQLADYLVNHDVIVILDDVGRGLVGVTPALWWGKALPPDKVIVVDSFTKRYGVPGLRLGFVRPCERYLPTIRGRVANCRAGVSNITAQLGLLLIQELENVGADNPVRLEIESRMKMLRQGLASLYLESVTHTPPQWGMYCLLDCAELHTRIGITGRELALRLQSHGIRVMDDRFLFPPGMANPRRENLIRLSIGAEARVTEGLKQFGSAMLRLSNSSPV